MSDLKALPPHSPADTPIYHTVVRALGVVVIMAVAGIVLLAFLDKPVPDSVVALGSSAVGALAGLLAPSPQRK